MLAEHIEKIVAGTPGAIGAILMGFDGIAVVQHLAPGYEEVDIESLAMEFSFRITELRKAAQSLDMGDVNDITLRGTSRTLVCRVLSEDYFVAVVLAEPGHLGKGRWLLRSASSQLVEDL
jgi:predicted regulator of Ras-like GTPase activity (Roadblock/LC7/MglB family)